MAIIVGLEGVLARHEWRLPLIESEGWPAYHRACMQDAANEPMVQLVRNMHQHGHRVYCVTTRPELWRYVTNKWLVMRGCMVDTLVMRGENDWRKDEEMRTEWVASILETSKEIAFAIDENEKACDVYRAAGIHTLQLSNPSNTIT